MNTEKIHYIIQFLIQIGNLEISFFCMPSTLQKVGNKKKYLAQNLVKVSEDNKEHLLTSFY